MAETWNKKEREKKKKALKKEKAEKKAERKENSSGDNSLESMMVYLDENGNFTSKPPDPRKKVVVNAEDMVIGVPKQEALDAEEQHTGIVTHFNSAKGYGFIKDQVTQQSVFVHINATTEEIKEGNKVSFDVEMGPKGSNAVNVKLVK